jgi:eukaryotic-like serine/threonine-protein kinase
VTTRALDGLVDAYLARLDTALDGIPERRRRELVADLGARIDAARLELPADSEAGVRAILASIGPPEDIASDEHAFHPWSGRRSRLRRGAAAIVAISLIAAASATVVESARSTGVRGSATVPEVIGRSESSAAAAVQDAHLTVGEVQEKEDPSVAAGTVIAVRPVAGTTVRRGSRVVLDVSRGL